MGRNTNTELPLRHQGTKGIAAQCGVSR